MEKYQSLHEDIESITNKEVVKRTSISVKAIILIAVGFALVVGGMLSEDPNSSVSTFLFTAAAFVLIGGIIKLFISRTSYVFRPTNSIVKKSELFFDPSDSATLQTCMEMKRFEDLKRVKRQVNSGVKVEAMVAGDGKFAAVQVSEYVPYSYEAVTPVMCYYGEDAKSFINFFK